MSGGVTTCFEILCDWVVCRPLVFELTYFGVALALVWIGLRRTDLTYFGWYAGWIVGFDSYFAILVVTMMLDTAAHFTPADYAFSIIYSFSGQLVRMAGVLWLGNLVLLRRHPAGQVIGPILAMLLSFSACIFAVSAILDRLVLVEL